MGLINYLGESKVIRRICELLKVTDVQVNGTSVVDSNGIADITGVGSEVEWTQIQENGTKIAEIEVDGTSYDVFSPTPTNVVANPSGQASTDLEKLQVGNTVYSITDEFSELSDVNIDNNTLADGQVPKWNATSQKWVNGDAGGAGHVILNDADTSLAQEDSLQFKGVYSHDDSTNEKTVVEVSRQMTRAEFNQLSDAEKKGLIQITDEVDADVINAQGVFVDTSNIIVPNTTLNSGSKTYTEFSYTATQDCFFRINSGKTSSDTLNCYIDNWSYSSYGTGYTCDAITETIPLKRGHTVKITGLGNYCSYLVFGAQQGSQNVEDFPFDIERVFRETKSNVSLTTNTNNTVKTLTLERVGYYLLSVVDDYQRNGNRSWSQIQTTSGSTIIYNSGGSTIADVRYDGGGYSTFTRLTIIKNLVPNNTININFWGNGYGISNLEITLYQLRGILNTSCLPDYAPIEHKLGRKWIDGRDIYEITLAIPNLSLGENTINHGITNFAKMIDCQGTINYNGDDIIVPYVSNTVSGSSVVYGLGVSNFNSTRYLIYVGPSFDVSKFSDGYITVKYVKSL